MPIRKSKAFKMHDFVKVESAMVFLLSMNLAIPIDFINATKNMLFLVVALVNLV